MVHREHGVGIIQVFGLEKGVRRQWPAEIHPFFPHFVEHRNDGVDLFGAHVSAFARMRIQATNQHMRLRDAEFRLQIVMQNPDDLAQEFRGDGIRNGFDGQMGCHQRDTHLFRCQHHHHFRTVRTFFKELGVSGKGDPRVVDNAFMHRTGDQRRELAVQAAVAGARQRLDNVAPVFSAELTGDDRGAKRNRQKREGARLLRNGLLAFNIREER